MSDSGVHLRKTNINLEKDINKSNIESDFINTVKFKNNIGSSSKRTNFLNLFDNNKDKQVGLSPISEIANSLIDTNIGTPLRGCGKSQKGKRSKSALCLISKYKEKYSTRMSPTTQSIKKSDVHKEKVKNLSIKKSSFESISNHEPNTQNGGDTKNTNNLLSHKSLISNNFTLNGNDETSGNINNNNNNDDNYKSRNNISQRRLLHFSAIQNGKEFFDDFTLYDEQTTISPTKFRRENLQFSPRNYDKFTSLDEYDGSSVDSDFGQFNSQITKFKFIEPKLPMKQQQQLNLEPSPRKFSINNNNNNNNNNNTLNNNFNYNFNIQKSPTNFKIFHSLSSGSMESIDDEWSDLIEMESLDEEQTFPSNLTSLISGHIKTIRTTPETKHNENKNFNNYSNNSNRPNVRRCLSLNEYTNNSRKGLFENDNNNNSTEYINSPLEQYNKNLIPKTPEILRTVQEQQLDLTPNSSNPQYIFHQHQIQVEKCFKRPEPPCFSPIQSKRYKTELKSQNLNSHQQYDLQQSKSASVIEDKENHNNISIKINTQEMGKCQRPIFRKSMSMNDADIMTALSRSSNEPELIGDFSKPFCLPLMEGKHRDLKSISSYTLAKLLHGDFKDTVANFKIIDCRYPYEYDGGHIKGASNLYTQEHILDELVNCKTEAPIVHSNGPKRNILVFHCEFSSERGPKLSRFLRNHDRWRNSNSYPALHYPEIYLLHGGYKEFYENFSELCDPVSYRPMLEPSFGEQYRQFRAKSKSWNGDVKGSCAKHGLKKSRSRLLL